MTVATVLSIKQQGFCWLIFTYHQEVELYFFRYIQWSERCFCSWCCLAVLQLFENSAWIKSLVHNLDSQVSQLSFQNVTELCRIADFYVIREINLALLQCYYLNRATWKKINRSSTSRGTIQFSYWLVSILVVKHFSKVWILQSQLNMSRKIDNYMYDSLPL